MATSDKKKAPVIGSTGVDVLVGTQSLIDGLVYDADGKVIEQSGDDKPVLLEEQLGAFKRQVHPDGSVSTFQTAPNVAPTGPAGVDVKTTTGSLKK